MESEQLKCVKKVEKTNEKLFSSRVLQAEHKKRTQDESRVNRLMELTFQFRRKLHEQCPRNRCEEEVSNTFYRKTGKLKYGNTQL